MKHILITGANRGIGLALAELYDQQGCRITAVCRSSSAAIEKIAARIITDINVTDEASVAKLAQTLKGDPIDILINNAGLLQDEVLGSIDFDSIRQQMEVNAYAPLRVTEALLPNLKNGSKIALITSRMGSIADNTSGGRYGYRASKAALNAFGKSLAMDLKESGIAVALLHPGFVKTRMVNFSGVISPEESAAGLVARIAELNLENSGSFWHTNGEELPW